MLWIVFGIMIFIAALVVAVPLYRVENRLSTVSVSAVVVLIAISATVYSYIGSPNVDPQQAAVPNIEAMVSSLADRLENNPDDIKGWKMLARSYLELKNLPGAVEAFEKAVELESGENAQTLSDLGEAILLGDGQSLIGRAGQLFESSLAIDPANPKALFYSGLAAMQRGNSDLAATRWEALLATGPPPDIESVLRERIAELRGSAPAPVAIPVAPAVTARVSLGQGAAAAGLQDTTVFIIARDPDQPSPPIAAVRRRLSELPTVITLSDADAMIPGRVPSGFETLEIIARVSITGQPIAQSGDWFGQQIVDTASAATIELLIDQQVP